MSYFDDIQFVDGEIWPCCRETPDETYPATYSIQLALSGSLYYSIDHGPEQVFQGPVLFWHLPEHHYRYGPAPTPRDFWHHHWVSFSGPRGECIVREGFAPLAGSGVLRIENGEGLAEVFRMLVIAVQTRIPTEQPQRVLLLEEILRLAMGEATRGEVWSPYRSGLEGLAAAIRRNPCRGWNLEQEAERIHLSCSHFRNRFKALIGRAPYDYILYCRMLQGAEFLTHTSLALEQITRRLGMDDAAHFSKVFKRQIGCPPGQYRRRRTGSS